MEKLNFLAQKEYSPAALAKMFHFERLDNKTQIPVLKYSTFSLLNGVYSSPESIKNDKIVLQ